MAYRDESVNPQVNNDQLTGPTSTTLVCKSTPKSTPLYNSFPPGKPKPIRDAVKSPILVAGSPSDEPSATLPTEVVHAWSSIPPSIRAALVSSELNADTPSMSRSTSVSLTSASSSNSISSTASEGGDEEVITEVCKDSGTKVVLRPLERAPDNVFEFTKTHETKKIDVTKQGSATVTTKTKVVTTGRGWRNIFSLPISYDVNMVPHGTILDPANPQLLEATGVHPEGYNRRFACVDAEVDRIYGGKIRRYFVARGIDLTVCVLNGGEPDKRPAAADKLLDALCAYKLRRREPFLAIGGGGSSSTSPGWARACTAAASPSCASPRLSSPSSTRALA